MSLTPPAADWRAAVDLAAALRRGERPTARESAGWGLDTGEELFAVVPVRVMRLQGRPLAYPGSNPTTHAAAQQWVVVDEGRMGVSGSRARVAGRSGVVDFLWVGVQHAWRELDGTGFRFANGDYKLVTSAPVWLDVLIHAVAFGRILDLTVPEWAAREIWKDSWTGQA